MTLRNEMTACPGMTVREIQGVYLALVIGLTGNKQLLGLGYAQTDCAKFWLVAYPSQGHVVLFDAHRPKCPSFASTRRLHKSVINSF